jgi:ribosome-associated protein
MIDSNSLKLISSEIKFSFIRAPGPGGQNVNKVATAAVLRFNVFHSPSLSEETKDRLLVLAGRKINQEGDLIIKAARYRTQERNKQDALERLAELINRASTVIKKRKKTMPTRSSTERRLKNKKTHGKNKVLRSQKPVLDD